MWLVATVVTKTAPVVQHHSVPETIRALAALPEPDYVDLFTTTARNATDYSAERWARAALEGASPTARFIVWQVLCGLRLEQQPSPDYVAGWKIADRGDSWIRLQAASWFMTAHVVVDVQNDRLSASLFVRYDHPIGALWWSLLSKGHQRAMPGLLRQAVRRMRR